MTRQLTLCQFQTKLKYILIPKLHNYSKQLFVDFNRHVQQGEFPAGSGRGGPLPPWVRHRCSCVWTGSSGTAWRCAASTDQHGHQADALAPHLSTVHQSKNKELYYWLLFLHKRHRFVYSSINSLTVFIECFVYISGLLYKCFLPELEPVYRSRYQCWLSVLSLRLSWPRHQPDWPVSSGKDPWPGYW